MSSPSAALNSPSASALSGAHRRYNPLLQEWVLVSPHRAKRPWSGAIEKVAGSERPEFDPSCYLCPGNDRVNGDKNPKYPATFAFDNDFSALAGASEDRAKSELGGLIKAEPIGGRCRVVCFSPAHHLTLAQMNVEQLLQVVALWEDEYQTLSANPSIRHIMTFENKGEMMGCSNPHPHGQIWATSFLPNIPARMVRSQQEHFQSTGSSLLQQYLEWELLQRERIVSENEHWVTVVPYWAVWPFESMIIPRRAVARISELSASEKRGWAEAIAAQTARYDNLFEVSFPYSMGVYQHPANTPEIAGFSIYQIFFPPLLRSATVRKFMVGFELTAEAQRDLTPEQAAERLRALSAIHYKTRG